MSRENDYRSRAAEAVDLAQRASSSADKGRLLAMAEAWLDLADRVHKITKGRIQRITEHPLVRTQLGRDQTEAE